MDSFRSVKVNGLTIPSGFASLTIDIALASAHLLGIEGWKAFDLEKTKIKGNEQIISGIRCLPLTV